MSDEAPEKLNHQKLIRRRNLTTLAILIGLAALFFVLTVVKVKTQGGAP